MADAAVADATDQQTFDYPVEIEEAGPAAKKVKVTVPRDRIDSYSQQQMGDIRSEAALPGFRKGKAPRHLIEKRFGKALRDQVQGDLLRESYQQALERNSLAVLGEPEFEDAENLKLPDEGDFTYSFTVEVQPEFDVPSVQELTVRKPKIEITDEHVQQARQNLREQQGSLMPVEDRGVEENDYLIADVVLKHGDDQIAEQQDAQLVARPGRISGIEVPDFADQVKGLKPDEERTLQIKAPEDHPDEKVRGKDLQIIVKLKDLKAMVPAEIDEAFLESLGFTTEQELLDALREQMVERVEADIKQSMRKQVRDHLLANTQFDVPRRLAERQADRVINRRAMDLVMRGMPREQVSASLEQIKQGADAEAARELQIFFILQKVADEKSIDVDERELNGQVAMMAINQGQRPEALRERMQKDGTMANLYIQMREQKTLDALIEEANVEEFEPSAEEAKQAVDEATGAAEPTEEPAVSGDIEAEDVT